MLEAAEQFKDDGIRLGDVERVSVWQQLTRALRELYEQFFRIMDPLASDVSSLKGRFGYPLAVGMDCGRNLVSSVLFPFVLIWVPLIVVMFLRGDVINTYTSNSYAPPLHSSMYCCNNQRAATRSCRIGSRHCMQPQALTWRSWVRVSPSRGCCTGSCVWHNTKPSKQSHNPPSVTFWPYAAYPPSSSTRLRRGEGKAGPQTTNTKPQTTNYKPETTNHKPQTTKLLFRVLLFDLEEDHAKFSVTVFESCELLQVGVCRWL